jgi:hypothetical protein
MSPNKADALEATKSALERALTHTNKSMNSRVVAPRLSYTEVAQKNTSRWNRERSNKKPR